MHYTGADTNINALGSSCLSFPAFINNFHIISWNLPLNFGILRNATDCRLEKINLNKVTLFREAVQLQAPIPHMVVGSHIIASVFPDIQV